MAVSICIPTYNRVAYFKDALASCLSQTLLPEEIIIGDDSTNDDTENYIVELQQAATIRIKYFRNKPSLKQAGNVNLLFSKVTADFTILLHDDDLLLPDSIQKL